MIPFRNRRQLKKILALAAEAAKLNDAELRARMQALRGQELRKVREQVYALVYAAFERRLNITPYDEQVLGALAMAEGCVAQMNTGEGKTVTAVFPACLYALSGMGAHIATVNPYLARRDCEWMRPVYELLGFTVSVTEAGQPFEEKKAAYGCDVLYGTHSEFGFDYLRDQLAQSKDMQVQREPVFMLVDEADSILLDEAVTPMILSGSGGTLHPMLPAVDRFVTYLKSITVQTLEDEDEYERLDEKYDYIVLQREHVAMLTSLGQKHAEFFFRLKALDDDLAIANSGVDGIRRQNTIENTCLTVPGIDISAWGRCFVCLRYNSFCTAVFGDDEGKLTRTAHLRQVCLGGHEDGFGVIVALGEFHVFAHVDHRGDGDTGDDGQDRHHHHDFHQRKATFLLPFLCQVLKHNGPLLSRRTRAELKNRHNKPLLQILLFYHNEGKIDNRHLQKTRGFHS